MTDNPYYDIIPSDLVYLTGVNLSPPKRASRHLLIHDWCPECQAKTDQELDGSALQVRCTICTWEATVTQRYATEMMQE